MFSVIRWIAGAWSAATFPPPDVWRLIATTVLTAELRGFASALSGYALRLTADLRALPRDFLDAGLASLVMNNSLHAIGYRSWRSRAGSNPFDDLRVGFHARERARGAAEARLLESATIDGRAGPPRIYLELTDVVSHAIWHGSCAGIPRVQLEVATMLVKSNPAVRVFGLHRQRWFELRPLIEEGEGDADAIFRLLKETFADFSWKRGLLAFLKRRRRRAGLRSPAPELKADDTLFIGGAFWINREVIRFSQEAAARRANLIVLIHDLIPITAPYFTGHDFRQEYIEMLRLPAHFIVTTERSRRELEAARQGASAAAPLTCASIIPLADEFPGSKRSEPPLTPSDRLASLSGEDFVLCVGTIEVRKNHLMLLSVWDELAEEFGDRLPRLVVAGRRGWKAKAALAKLDEARGSGNRIAFVEAPSDDELRWLYSSCSFTVFPSYFEGWGLPVGESFWFGKPCAASNTSSIPAVGRDLCAYFSPFDPHEMKDAIRSLLNADVRGLFQRRIESTPLRSWVEVARDVEAAIAERRPPSDRIPSPPA